MAKKCPKCECPAGEKWAVPFADFLSLLLALFIALLLGFLQMLYHAARFGVVPVRKIRRTA